MTEHDETAKRIIMDAAKQAGYHPRHWPDGSVGFIGPAKVGRLLEAIHHGIVAALADAEPAAPALDAADVMPLVRALEDFRDNWDCDEDAHRYNTPCRCCEARCALDALPPAWREAARGGGR